MTYRRRPGWIDRAIPPARDLARPEIGPQHARFETEADALARSRILAKRLRAHRPRLVEQLEACADGGEYCRQPACPICARMRRRFICAEALSILDLLSWESAIMTAHIDTVPAGSLASVDLRKCRRWLRQKIRGARIGSAVIIGGIEANWNDLRQVWVVHLHALIVGYDEEVRASITRRFASTGARAAVVFQALMHPVRQISYIAKFATYHRPGQHGPWRRRAYPMPERALVEYGDWLSVWRFEDFVFCFNAQQRGAHVSLRDSTPRSYLPNA